MISSSGFEGFDISGIEQNRQSIRHLLLDRENIGRAGPEEVSPSLFAVVTSVAIVAGEGVGGSESGGARLHGDTYLVRFPLVCQSRRGLQFRRIRLNTRFGHRHVLLN